MSGILRNTWRFVGTATSATNNSTKYLRSMTLMTSRLNNSMALNDYKSPILHYTEANKKSTDFLKTMRAAVNKILSIFANKETQTSNVSHFIVSLSSGKIGLLTDELPGRKKNFILPPLLSTKLNGIRIKPISNKPKSKGEKTSFNLGDLNVSHHAGKLIFKVKDTDKTFTVNHAVHVEASQKQLVLENRNFKIPPRVRVSNDVIVYDAKLTSKTPSGEILGSTSIKPVERVLTQWKKFGTKSPVIVEGNEDELTVVPNKYGEMKLQFPMDVSLEGARQEIKIENSDDTLTVYLTVDIQAYRELDGSTKNTTTIKKKKRRSKIGEFEIQLESGDLLIEAREPGNKMIIMKQEARIIVNLDSEVPSIVINPYLKTKINY